MSEQKNAAGRERRRDIADLQFIGLDFARPECVLTTAAGEKIFASDRRGGDSPSRHGRREPYIGRWDITPNGFAMLRDRSFLNRDYPLAGGVWKIDCDGSVAPRI